MSERGGERGEADGEAERTRLNGDERKEAEKEGRREHLFNNHGAILSSAVL